MTSRYICQVGLQAQDGLPRNQFENVWHFVTPAAAASTADCEAIQNLIATYYQSMVSWLSPVIQPTVTVKYYDEAAGKPRPLLDTLTFALQPAPNGNAIPENVALCLSYYAGRNLAGLRGRMYFGPFNTSALAENVAGTESGYGVRPNTSLMHDLCNAAVAVTASTAATWCVRTSKPSMEYRPITAGWVDNEWDTMRSRRIEADQRFVFAASPD